MTLTLNPSEFRSYKISCKDGSYMIFDFAGALSSISDSDGNTATAYRAYTQDVSHIIDGAGRTTTFEYVVINGENHLKRVIAPSTHVTTFEYDDNGSLTDVIYNDGTKVCFEYETETINDTTYYLIDKAIDIDGSYLEYEYSQSLAEAQRTQVTSVQEYSAPLKNPDGSLKRDSENNLEYNEGNRIEVDYNLDNTTRYTYICGTDSTWALYEFDNLGRTVCIRNEDGSFSQVGYTADSTGKKANKISHSSAGEEYVNNLLLDSSAENATLGWTATSSTNVVDTENHFLGYKSLKVTTDTATTRTGYYQNVSVIANKDYTFSTYVKTDNVTATGTNGAGMYVKFYDASNNEIANSAQCSDGVKGTNGWQRINFTFTTPAGAVRARVFLVLMSATGTAYFDCAQLEDGNTMNDYNLLQNSSFTSSSAWTLSGFSSEDGINPVRGELHLTGSANASRSATQTVQINRQKTSFTFSAVAAGHSVPLRPDTDRAFGVKVVVHFSNGESIEETASFNTATSAKQKASATVMIPKDYQEHTVTYLEYSLIYSKNANVATFDDCMLAFDETGTTYTYDSEGNPISSSDNAGRNTAYTFDNANELTSSTDAKNETYSYTYDEEYEHRVTTATIDALKTRLSYTYDSYGNVTGVQMNVLDDSGAVKAGSLYLESSTGYNVEYTVDENGNEIVDTQKSGNYVTSVTDQRGKVTSYDVNTTTGLTNNVTDANGNVVTYTYYPDSFLSHTIEAQTNKNDESTKETVTYEYDDYNRLESINRNGFEYGFNYDDFGNTTSITVADRTLVTNVYAPNNGYQTSKTYGNGTVYTYTYDDYGRVTSVAVNGVTKFNTVYNKKGQVAYIYDIANNRKLVYTYDISGRVLSMTYTGYATISTTYDEFDRPNGVTYTFAGQEKSMSFTYKEANLKDNAVLISGDTRSVEYDDLSRETSTTIGTDFTREIAYLNVSGNKTTTLPASVSYSKGSVPIFNESYTYDNIGNIKTVTNNGVTVTYSYDGLNQLTRASGSDGTVTKYFYNDGGNINYKVNADGSKTHYVYDAEWKDLLVSFGGQSITYDEIGNPISYLGNTMSWTGRTLDSIVKADGTQISYTYDLDGIRTKKVVNGTTTEYFVNGTTILAQKTGENIIWFIYDSDDEILGFTYNDTPYYYVKNLQGDVLKVIDANGNVVASYTYDPWGKIISSTGTMADINPIRYRGYYYDSETGLYYLNSRYYDPDTCRFINADGQLNLQEGMTGYNLFQYCGNNPVNRVDPTGEAWWHWVLGAAVVVACAVAVVATAGGAAAAVAAVATVGSGFAATTTASTVAAAAFIGSATAYGMAVIGAASTSDSIEEFNEKGDWDVVLSSIGGAVFNGVLAYVGTRPQTSNSSSTQKPTEDTFLPDEYYMNNKAPKQSVPNSSYVSTKYNTYTGKYETSTAFYDNAGRQTIRIDWTNHGYSDHGNPHVHYTYYNAQYRDGKPIRWD